jgi:hypothetical protein
VAYSESPLTVLRMREYLQPLLESSTVAWNIEPLPGAARRFAYKLREGLYAAAANPEQFPDLAQLHGRVAVRVVSRGRVEVGQAARLSVSRGEASEASLVELRPEGHTEVETREGVSLVDITLRWELGAEAKLYFPKANLSERQLHDLWIWANASGVLFFENAGALTLMRHDPEVEEFAWKPGGEAADD